MDSAGMQGQEIAKAAQGLSKAAEKLRSLLEDVSEIFDDIESALGTIESELESLQDLKLSDHFEPLETVVEVLDDVGQLDLSEEPSP